MDNEKLYLLYEFTVPPESLKEVKAVFAEALPLALKEPGCEAMHPTSIDGEPNKLVFFEIFSSEDAHKFHMEQAYTKKLFAALDGKLTAPPVVTRLRGLYGRMSESTVVK
jgi:quinol monooxygenase YgiN